MTGKKSYVDQAKDAVNQATGKAQEVYLVDSVGRLYQQTKGTVLGQDQGNPAPIDLSEGGEARRKQGLDEELHDGKDMDRIITDIGYAVRDIARSVNIMATTLARMQASLANIEAQL